MGPVARLAYSGWQRTWYKAASVASRTLMGQGPFRADGKAVEAIVRGAGDWSVHLGDLPRLPVRRLSGNSGVVIHVGDDAGARLLDHLLFEGTATKEPLGRSLLPGLGRRVDGWLSECADLVVCDTSPVFLPASRARMQFSVPEWINHVLEIPCEPDQLLAGRRMARYRNYINRAVRDGFEYRYTRSLAEFDHFYHRIYRPFVNRRHGQLARTTPYGIQRWWFEKGGLLLVCRNGHPVAGAITYMAGDTCFQMDIGVIQNGDESMRHLNKVLVWFNLLWAHEQGAARINLGGTRPWRSNGAFRAKSKWGAQGSRRQGLHRKWRFFADCLPDAMVQRIDELGLIVENCGRMLALERDRPDLDEQAALRAARADGLDGIHLLPPVSGGTSRAVSALQPAR